jgi:very-short-patch-repair endonuclease
METRLRLTVLAAGLVEPDVQCPVSVDGHVVARLDLGWPDLRLGVEYDGAVHRERRQHSRDLARHNGFRAMDWTVFQVDARLLERPRDWLTDLVTLVPPAPADVVRAFGCLFVAGRP